MLKVVRFIRVWVGAPYTMIHGYECFGGSFWVYLQIMLEDAHKMYWPIPQHPLVILLGLKTQKTKFWILTFCIFHALYHCHVYYSPINHMCEAINFTLLTCIIFWSEQKIQGESLARGSKLLSIKNYVIEIMTWKFIYAYRERCKTGPAHNRCWTWSPFTSKHTWMRFFKIWNTFPKVSTLTAWISWRIASLSCSIVRGVFMYTLPFNRPQRKKSACIRSASTCP